jgi:hypothetical protein
MVTSQSTVTLREVTDNNLFPILKLSVTEDQKQFVAANATSIAQAYFNREIAWFRAIYADENTPVGFLMLEDMPETYIWPFRFTAVAVNTDGQWRFHQMQFSFATTEAPDERVLPDESTADPAWQNKKEALSRC